MRFNPLIPAEGVSDQFYLSAIEKVLIRERMIAPQKEIVFAPSGGVRGVPGITSLVAAKNDDLPYVILDSDKGGNDFRHRLEAGTYKDCKGKIISIHEVTSLDQSEVEDIIPYKIIENKVQYILRVNNDVDEEFEYELGMPILLQIEQYAEEHSIELPQGWRVELAPAFNRKAFRKKKVEIPDENIKRWKTLFNKLLT